MSQSDSIFSLRAIREASFNFLFCSNAWVRERGISGSAVSALISMISWGIGKAISILGFWEVREFLKAWISLLRGSRDVKRPSGEPRLNVVKLAILKWVSARDATDRSRRRKRNPILKKSATSFISLDLVLNFFSGL